MKSEAKYSIQMASKLTGVGIHTLRKWESRYNLISPERDDGGRRIYNEKEIEKLQLLNELTTLGESIGHLKDRDLEELKKMSKKILKEVSPKKDIFFDGPKINPDEVLRNLLMALEHYKLDIISHELEKVNLILNRKEMAFNIFLPLLREVGKRVFQGSLSITQELAIHSIIRVYLTKVINQNLSSKSKSPHNIIVSSLEGETNEFPLLISCLLLEHYQMRFYYLGTGIPAEAIVEAAKALNSTKLLIGISASSYQTSKKLFDGQLKVLSNSIKDIPVLRLGLTESGDKNGHSFTNIPTVDELNKKLMKW